MTARGLDPTTQNLNLRLMSFSQLFDEAGDFSRLLTALRHPERIEGWDETDLPTEERTALAYGDHRLDPDDYDEADLGGMC